ncbi:MAG: cyclodeaminase [Gammaproteobacteria bacterium]|nr:cyclodeaminase [Gammaproteobacteria bacterium]
MNALILTEQELRRCTGIDETSLQAVENAFTWLSEGKAYMPPIMHIEVADRNGDVDIKSAYVAGLDRFAVKIGSGFFDNPSRGLPSSSAMMVLLSAATGFCEAVLLDNGYLTDLRTGLAGAVAARRLARDNINTVGVVGAGAQARYQVECLTLVRKFDRLLVLGRDPERQAGYIAEMRRKLGITVTAANSMEQLVGESDLVVTTTSSRTPLIRAEWLHPGLHITAMGSDLAGKQELAAGVLAAADLLVCDRKSQCFSMGELQHGLAAGMLTEDSPVVELGELTGAEKAGRSNEQQVTVCDLTGTGVQDTAIATVAYDAAASRGIGTVISN